MANVCLIYPRDINVNFFPLGIGYIASYLRENNHNVTLLDITENDIHLLSKLKTAKPDIIGISITTPQLKISEKIIKFLKNTIPGVPIVAGGIHPTYFKEEFIEKYNVDYVVCGEGEITANELCNSIQSKNKDLSQIKGLIFKDRNKIVRNPSRELMPNLNVLPFPARDLVNYETYLIPPGLIRGAWTERSANITTSRGCPGRCTFCAVNYLCRKYRRRSVDNVLQEIEWLVERYNIDGIFFMDDTFLMNTKWIEEFSEKFISRNFNFKWTCYSRIDTINEDILKAIKRAGCFQVELGIESCSERTLKRIKKKVNPEQIIKAVKMIKSFGFRIAVSFVFGFPEDTEEDLYESIKMLPILNLDFTLCYFAIPYPGSELFEQAISENRIIEKDMSKWYIRSNNIWKVNLGEDTLFRYRNKFLKASRYKNVLYFIKNPVFLFKLLLFMLKNFNAFYKSIRASIKSRCFDDFGYYFYTYISNNLKGRNKF